MAEHTIKVLDMLKIVYINTAKKKIVGGRGYPYPPPAY